MLIHKSLSATLPALLALSLASPVAAADPELAPPIDSSFIIKQSNPDQIPDPHAFELAETQLLLGKDNADRMTMPVEIGNRGSFNFVIDTGSQRTIVATELAQKLALPVLAPVEIISMAGRVTVSSVTLDGLRFGDHFVEQLNALSINHNDLGGAGIIGLDGLKNKRLTLDFKERRMDVGKSRRVPKTNDPDTIVVEARTKLGQLILVDSKVDGKRVSVILDTGAEVSVGNMALFNNLKVKRLVVPPTPTMLTSVTGVSVPAQFTVVRQMTIGGVVLENVPMVFLDAAPFAELGLAEKPAMLLGMRMLRMFDQVAIDFGNRHVDFRLKRGALDSASGFRQLASNGATTLTLPR